MPEKHFDLPPMDLLQAFEAAARNLSFTKAAAELFLTQSAVSRQIIALEQHLGFSLFERRPRALLLTEKGQVFYRTVLDALQRLHEATRKLKGEKTARILTVTTTPGLASLWLIPRLAGFTKAHPKVDVRISANTEIVNLERSGIDIAIRYCAKDSAGNAIKLFGEEVFPVCSPSLNSDRSKPLTTPADLKNHVLLHFDYPRGTPPWLDWSVWLEAVGTKDLKPAGTFHFSHYDQLILAAITGQGVALGRIPMLKQLLREGKLVAPFRRTLVSPHAFYLIESATARSNTDVKNFAAWALEETGKDAKLEKTGARAKAPASSPLARRR